MGHQLSLVEHNEDTQNENFSLYTLAFGLLEVEAGFRCNSIFTSILSDGACKASCVILGHTSGICDNDRKCHCSGKAIDTDAFLELLPSRCDLGLKFCQGTCHAIGRRDGICYNDYRGCECSTDRLTPSEFALCGAESTCRLDCQRRGKGSGRCNGWSCECFSK